MTIAKTLSVVTPIKIKTISSLAAYAGLQKCISVIDARSQKIFVCVYDQGQALIDEQLIFIDEFEILRNRYPDYSIVGQTDVIHCPSLEVNLANNMYLLAQNEEYIDNVDSLVPCYLKDVEAKKICL